MGEKLGLLKLQKVEEERQRETCCKGPNVSSPMVAPGCVGKRELLHGLSV